jgi:hypothetical protein
MQTCTVGRTAGQVEGSFVRKCDGESGWRRSRRVGQSLSARLGQGRREKMLARASFPTGDDPAGLLDRVAAWLAEQESRYGRLAALGIASFGPVDLDPASPTWGTSPRRRRSPGSIRIWWVGCGEGCGICRSGSTRMSMGRRSGSMRGERRRGWMTSST